MARTEHTRYLVMAQNYWGIGNEIEDAVEALLGAGGTVTEGYGLIEFDETAIFQSVNPVHGFYEYTAAEGHEFPNAPSTRTVEPIEAMTSRKQDINRALVNDVIDADIREDLREERDDLTRRIRDLTTGVPAQRSGRYGG